MVVETSQLFASQRYAVLFLAGILDSVLVSVFWTKKFINFSPILVIPVCDSFTLILFDENSKRFSPSFSQQILKNVFV